MTQTKTRLLRLHALATATALALAAPTAFAGHVNNGGLKDGGQYDHFIVQFLKNAPEHGNSEAVKRALVEAGHGQGVGIARSRRLAVGADAFKTDRKLDKIAAEALMRRLANNPHVDYVEIDKLNKPLFTPNDTNYSQQWGYQDSDAGIRANEAWDVTTGVGTVVAVIDTGITNHTDLNANILPGYDFISDTDVSVDGDGRDSNPADPGDWYNSAHCGPLPAPPSANSSWHGTHVAGTIAAVTNNAKGVAGVAYGAKVVPARVLGRCGGYDSDIADAMVWASGGTVAGVPANANPAEVINLSLGGDGPCAATSQAAINSAVSRGTTLVIAAGNDNENVSGHSPGNCANIVSVASVTSTGARSSFSNYGTGIDVAGPGSTIMSTINAGTTTPGAESYTNYSGTSMATPHVAGIVALMQAKATTPKTPAEIESLLKSTARPFPVAPSQTIGSGIADAKAAVDAVNGLPPPGTLTNGVAKTGLGATAGSSLNYTMVVPSGATGLKFVMSGGTGDADMYVKFGSAPTDTVYDCRPYATGNAETCNIATAQVGTYYVRLKAFSTFSGVSLTGSYSTVTNTAPTANFTSSTSGLTATFTDTSTDPQGNATIASRSWNFGDGGTSTATNPSHAYASAGTYTVSETVTDNGGLSNTKSASVTLSNVSCGGTVLCSGTAVALPSVATGGVSSNYTMPIVAGHTVTFTLSGGTGDADMYVKAGSAPTSSTYDCRPYATGNSETCTFTPAANTTYYINVRAYAGYSGVSLKGTSN